MDRKKVALALGLPLVVGMGVVAYWLSQANSEEGADQAALVARGTYLAHHVTMCADCHSERDWQYFSGPIKHETLGAGGERFGPELGLPGVVWSRNITPAGRVAGWSDEELARVITSGTTPDGGQLFPIMPYLDYSHLCDEDVDALVAWVRSLKPIEREVPKRELVIPDEALAGMAPPRDPWACPDPSANPVDRGRYLVHVAACADCHTPMANGQPSGPKFSGGFVFPLESGGVARSANITPHAETGIGRWTEDHFVAHFRARGAMAGNRVEQGAVNSYMPWNLFAEMEEADLRSIYAFLRTVEPVDNRVQTFSPIVRPLGVAEATD